MEMHHHQAESAVDPDRSSPVLREERILSHGVTPDHQSSSGRFNVDTLKIFTSYKQFNSNLTLNPVYNSIWIV